MQKDKNEVSEDINPLIFSRVVEAISNQGKDDPQSLKQVGELLKGMPENCLSVATVLQLRNNTLKFFPDRIDVMKALEMRAIMLL